MASCRNGHTSEWPDWCSICGERLTSASPASADPPAATGATQPASFVPCTHCNAPRHVDDVFCESCGFDFLTGTLPGPLPHVTPSSPAPFVAPLLTVSIDPDYFKASVGDIELELPVPLPAATTIDITGVRMLIGRRSESRGIYPDVDIDASTADPAVSSRHALVEFHAESGRWTLTDLGSTNGTATDASGGDVLTSGDPRDIDIAAGASFWIGAWTRIDIKAN